ncbi:MAG: nucleotide-binding protein [Cyclobacteriaceae bacterium]|jgi:hypothetical protein
MSKKTSVFIGSSVESLAVAYSVQSQLEYATDPTVWTQGIFNLTNTTIDDLIEVFKNSDFAIFVFTPDDSTKIRGEEMQTVRDNLIFELGLACGIIGKERVFAIHPRDIENFHIPTDLYGITFGNYNSNRGDNNIQAAIGPSVFQIQKQIEVLLTRKKEELPRKVIKTFVAQGSGPSEVIFEHPYDYEPQVTVLYSDGSKIMTAVRYEEGKVIIGGHLNFDGKVIMN